MILMKGQCCKGQVLQVDGRIKRKSDNIRLPREFMIFDVKDCYFWYVIKGNLSEDAFWNLDISFINGILANENAYEQWLSYQIERRSG